MDAELILSFHHLPAVTPAVLKAVLIADRLANWAHWSLNDLVDWGIEPDRAARIIDELGHWAPDEYRDVVAQFKIRCLVFGKSDYPPYLAAISSPPPVLYVRGSVTALHRPAIAIVGTRRPSPYGLHMTEQVAGKLSRAQITIVSGLAYGIDAAAHRAAVNVGTPTIAVMGTGINRVYPWDHRELAEEIIAQGGALVTEFPVDAEPERHHFPQRNRIIAGLARAVWLVEAGEKSGALITMKFGLDENRDLYVLPGDCTRPTATGPLNWLRLGAAPAVDIRDFRATFPALAEPHPVAAAHPETTNNTEVAIITALDRAEPRHIDDIAQRCRLEASVIAGVLALLELRGAVRHHGGMRYTTSA